MSGPVRAIVGIVAAVVALNVVLTLIDSAGGGRPGGPRSSSYATDGDGLAAYHDLLERSGHRVSRLRDLPRESNLDPRSTVVVLDPSDIARREEEALRDFVRRGGTLVAGGEAPEDWLDGIVEDLPAWDDVTAAGAARPLAPVPETAGVREVRTAGDGGWHTDGGALPALRSGKRAVVSVARVGVGRVVLFADPSPLQNRLLDEADNAAFGVAVAGDRGRPVTFVESVHGYGSSRGLAALPTRWKVALAGLLLALLAWVASCMRRIGPPEDEARELPPPRRDYVDAVAAALARAGDPGETAARVRAAARERVARRAGLGPQPTDEQLKRAAERLGLDPDEAAALTGDEPDLVASGRALAAAGRSRR